MNYSDLKTKIIALHDQLKTLIFICDIDFPAEAADNLTTLQALTECQSFLGTFVRQLLLRIFQYSLPLTTTARFEALWSNRSVMSDHVPPLQDLAESIRDIVEKINKETLLVTEAELNSSIPSDLDDLVQTLYYATTVQGSLGWYMERLLGRLLVGAEGDGAA